MLEELYYEGTGSISLFDKPYRAYVILRPNSGDIVVKVQHNRINGWKFLKKVREGEFFGREYKLENLEIVTPLGKLCKKSLGLYPVLVNPGPSSIFDSYVLKIAYSSHAGIATLVFRPKDSFLVFESQTTFSSEDENYYELLFLGFRPKILPSISLTLDSNFRLFMQAGKENKNSSSGKEFTNFQGDFVLVRSNLDLFESSKRDDLCKVLSLLNGGKVSLALGYALRENEFKVAFSFPTDICTVLGGVGNPFRTESSEEYLELVETFVKTYFSYVGSLKEEEKRRFNLFVEYFIEGISMNTILESKLITLYTALEIMDDSDTLTKDSLKKAYELDEDKATFFKELRNKIVHNGLSVREAVEKIPNYVRDKSRGRRNLDTSFLGKEKDWACYFFLICMLYKKLLYRIGADDLTKKLGFDLCVVAS